MIFYHKIFKLKSVLVLVSDFMLNKATTVEKLGHAFHMQQTWLLAKEHYLHFKENSLADANEICACSNDVQSNGVIEMKVFFWAF